MAVTAKLVKELRERTGVGMMECKKALVEADADIEAAAEILRTTGLAKADKKSGRVAAEGLITVLASEDGSVVSMVEVNSETDFLAKADDFISFGKDIATAIIDSNPADLLALNDVSLGDYSVEVTRQNLISKLGENLAVRRFIRVDGDVVAGYSHGGKIGVIVSLEGGTKELAKDIALHIAAMNPQGIDESSISSETIEKEKAIFKAQALESGKPEEIVEKMIVGRMKKFVNEVTLVGQSFVKDPDQTVEQLLKSAGAKVISFDRLEVGEGIEKKEDNFADEVMAQIK